MRYWKWFVGGLSVLTLIGVIGTGVSLGTVYEQSLYDEEILIEKAIESVPNGEIIIDTDIPVVIKETTGEPKVVLRADARGVFLEQPHYTLDVTQNGDTTSITGQCEEHFGFIMEDDEEMIVYLPEQAIKRLEVSGRLITFEGDVAIDTLYAEAYGVDMQLTGQVKQVLIDARDTNLTLDTDVIADVTIDSSTADVQLDGSYQSVTIEGYNRLNVGINTLEPAVVALSGYGEANLQGAFKQISVDEIQDLMINATNEPEYIVVDGDYSDVKLRVPESISGIYGTYDTDEMSEGISSNFEIAYTDKEDGDVAFKYGEQGTYVEIKESNTVSIFH